MNKKIAVEDREWVISEILRTHKNYPFPYKSNEKQLKEIYTKWKNELRKKTDEELIILFNEAFNNPKQ